MAVVDVLMPKMGESVMEGTVLKWLKAVGETVEEEESLIEVATDKVDTDIPSPQAGKIVELLAAEGDVIEIGSVIARIETEAGASESAPEQAPQTVSAPEPQPAPEPTITTETVIPAASIPATPIQAGRFYSPLVLNIARKEGIAMNELESVPGTGKEGRVTKKDILGYLQSRGQQSSTPVATKASAPAAPSPMLEDKVVSTAQPDFIPEPREQEKPEESTPSSVPASITGEYEIEEMSRMRKIIAERMIDSRKISAHVTSFVEADVTNIVYWRNRWKTHFKEKEGTALTYTPIFIEAVVKAIKDYPRMNVSVEGDNLIIKKDINVGMAVALPSGDLIVPVIKNADQLNVVGLTKQVNDLARRARAGKIKPEELEGGTYTVTNVGSFGNMLGTPILVQPQVGILALGAVIKKPSVIETSYGDTIGIRHKMFLSHSYDHRVVDGALGGMFVRRVADYLEQFDLDRKV